MPKESQNPNGMGLSKQVMELHEVIEPMPFNSTVKPKSAFSGKQMGIVTAVSVARISMEYPFWSIRVNMQINPENKHIFKTAKKMYQQNGIKGFYAGAPTYFVSMLVKQTYRLPAISLLPEYFAGCLPEEWQDSHALHQTAAVSTLAVAETFLFSPIERLIRYQMAHGKEGIQFKLSFLYKGAGVNLAQNMISWNLFSSLESFGQTQAKALLQKEKLNLAETFGVGLFVGTGMTLITQPIDALQSFAQTQKTKDNKDRQPILSAFREHLKKQGMRACFAGTRAALLQGVIGASTTVLGIEAFREQKKESAQP